METETVLNIVPNENNNSLHSESTQIPETTTLYLFKINHPINLEYKYKYFINMLEESITTNNMVILPQITAKINAIITSDFMLKLKTLNE
jgi:hypothetical protein